MRVRSERTFLRDIGAWTIRKQTSLLWLIAAPRLDTWRSRAAIHRALRQAFATRTWRGTERRAAKVRASVPRPIDQIKRRLDVGARTRHDHLPVGAGRGEPGVGAIKKLMNWLH